MTGIVTCLPISPRASESLGYLLTPFVINFLSGQYQLPSVLPMNLLGSKKGLDEDAYWRSLAWLGATGYARWSDADEAHQILIKELLDEGIKAGFIVREWCSIIRCPCGKLETLDTPGNRTQILWTRPLCDKSQLICRVCGVAGVGQMEQCLLINLPDKVMHCSVFPAFLDAEYRQLISDYSNVQLLLSRTASTAPRVATSLGDFGIDVDFFWACYLVSLHKDERAVTILISGHKQVLQVVFCVMVSALFKVPLPRTIILLPYLKMWDHALDDFSPLVARYLLMYGLDLKKKVVVLPSSLVYWIQHSLRPNFNGPVSVPTSMSVGQLLANFHGNMLNETLAACRKNKTNTLSESQRIALNFVLRTSF